MKDFAKALSLADKVVLADIYAARETDTLGISSETLQTEIRALGHECYYFPSFDEIENFLLENCINGDLPIYRVFSIHRLLVSTISTVSTFLSRSPKVQCLQGFPAN